jgi:hypothetical protein
VAFINLLLCYLLIVKYQLELIGAGIVISLCYLLGFILLGIISGFYLPTLNSFRYAWSYLKEGLPYGF